MQKFMCMHTLPSGVFTRENIYQLAEAAQHDPSVKGYRSFINLTEGKACCIMEASDRETIADWFHRMGVPYDGIVLVELEGERGVIEEFTEQPVTLGVGVG